MKDKLYEQGLRMRKRVLGADYVERQFRAADEFTRPIQEMATRAGWGTTWARPGLGLRERSMITIAFVVARGKPEELMLHLRGAMRNGVTRNEVREILLQSAVYCGFPEALGAFRVAKEFFAAEAVAAKKKPAKRKRGG